MKLMHDFNEYVVGLVVTDTETNRSVNFQFDQYQPTNHPEPPYRLKWGCDGDDSYQEFTETELEIITDYVFNLDNSEKLEKEYTAIMYGDSAQKLKDLHAQQGYLTYSDILELSDLLS